MSKTTGVLGLNKPLFGTNPLIANDLDTLEAVITGPRTVTNYAANGAIAQKEGTVTISKASAAAMTIADPVSGAQSGTATGDDGRELRVVSKTAFAHVFTLAGGVAGGSNHTITLGGAIGDGFTLIAIAGKWFVRPSTNATISA